MKKNDPAKRRFYVWFILCTAAVLLVALATATVLNLVFIRIGLIENGLFWVIIFAITSVLVGVALAAILGRVMFRPVETIIDGMTKLSRGDFSVRIDLGKYEGMKNLAESFNALAEELENTKLLRSDFVNEFSHELKTPLVSLSGLISLMQTEKLSEDKRRHYLGIMEEEARRLTDMTSNTLYLSKIEAQNILTGLTRYNVSEQIRKSVLLLERKWSKKGLTPVLDFDEHTLLANEDMMKQVWVNLIDNAIKFSDEGEELRIDVASGGGSLTVSVENTGKEIPEAELPLIFAKFYRCNGNHLSEGNGIGLSIVKHIVDLHRGSVSVVSREHRTVFSVTLPQFGEWDEKGEEQAYAITKVTSR